MQLSRSPAQYSASRRTDRKSTRLNSSHSQISYAVFCLKKKNKDSLLLLGDDPALLQTGDDSLNVSFEVLLVNYLLLLAAGEDRGLVGDVLKLDAGTTRG